MGWKKWMLSVIAAILVGTFSPYCAFAQTQVFPEGEGDRWDIEAQLDALGKEELMDEVPESAKEFLKEANLFDLSPETLLQLSPQDFFQLIWQTFLHQLQQPMQTLGMITAVVILCAMLSGLKSAVAENSLSQIYSTVAVLCILTSVIVPILDCIVNTSVAVKDASTFMLTFIPVFAASLTAAGQPITGATYNLFLFSTCQAVSQIVAQMLIPLMGIYLALCVVGAVVPNIKISSATATIKSIVSWVLGFMVTVFVGLLSIQSLVSGSADNVTTKAAKFVIGSFVPVVGGALSDAFLAAQGCLRLIKTSVGMYGILVALFIFLPVLVQTVLWYFMTGIAGIAGDILGVGKVSEMMKSCSTVLGILLAIILCFALLLIVSTTVVLITGMGAG